MQHTACSMRASRPLTRSWSCFLLHLPALMLVLMIVAYAVLAGRLALQRHWNLDSQALDMGYADQVTWNTLHGRPLRFTVFRGDVGAELGRALTYGPGADRDSLLAYHVELLFLPLSLLYLIHPGPETLIVLLAIVVALGALPAYWIAHGQLGQRGAALAFAAMYLLFPSIQAATLADFHAVSMAGTLLLFALHFLLAGRVRAFAGMAAVAVAAREEVGLVVGMMGLYVWLRPRVPASLRLGVPASTTLGLLVAALSFSWAALCFGVIIPYFNGGAPSLFVARYGDAARRLREFAAALPAGQLVLPIPDYTLRYVAHLLASTGFVALLAPFELALAAPPLAINGLSGSVWQHGGGAHYTAEAVPGLLLAAIAGTRWLARQCWQRLKVPPASAALAIALAGLGVALVEHWREGILPPARCTGVVPTCPYVDWLAPSAHAARLPALLARIPSDAPVSAQSNVFPHLSHREQAYVFPAVENAQYVLIDVAGTSDPLYPDELFTEGIVLLTSPGFTLLAGADGYLLFSRTREGATGGSPAAPPPPAFYSFARAAEGERVAPVAASFGNELELVGYRAETSPEVNFAFRRARPVVYLRAQRPIERAYRLTLFVVGQDNLARIYDDGNAAQLWYPTHRWRPGELIRVRYPPLNYRRGDRLGFGVQIGAEADASRLPARSATATLVDGGRVVLLGPLP